MSLVRALIALCLLLCITVVAAAPRDKVFAWVPTPECRRLPICYEGPLASILFAKEVDELNPCHAYATVQRGTCASHGFPKTLGADLVFKKLSLWVRSKKDLPL